MNDIHNERDERAKKAAQQRWEEDKARQVLEAGTPRQRALRDAGLNAKRVAEAAREYVTTLETSPQSQSVREALAHARKALADAEAAAAAYQI